jgi:hypothetical protein
MTTNAAGQKLFDLNPEDNGHSGSKTSGDIAEASANVAAPGRFWAAARQRPVDRRHIFSAFARHT